jgi:hypothetical protein
MEIELDEGEEMEEREETDDQEEREGKALLGMYHDERQSSFVAEVLVSAGISLYQFITPTRMRKIALPPPPPTHPLSSPPSPTPSSSSYAISTRPNTYALSDFSLVWRVPFHSPSLKSLRPSLSGSLPLFNTLPGSSSLTRKDNLHLSLSALLSSFPHMDGSFWPRSFPLPDEMDEFLREWRREEEERTNEKMERSKGEEEEPPPTPSVWILKPPLSSRGENIKIVTSADQVIHLSNQGWIDRAHPLAQRYLHNPILIHGCKCTLRLYVLVVSLDPLIVYVYPEGNTVTVLSTSASIQHPNPFLFATLMQVLSESLPPLIP